MDMNSHGAVGRDDAHVPRMPPGRGQPLVEGSARAVLASASSSQASSASAPAEPGALHGLREAMLRVLRGTDAADHPLRPRLKQRLQQARDVHRLWSIRHDLMVVMTAHYCPRTACERMSSVDALFDGFVFEFKRSRPTGHEQGASHRSP